MGKEKSMKYHNTKTVIDGIKFDSKKEALMYSMLKLMEKNKEIKDLKLQPKFVLMEGYKGIDGKKVRDLTYRADFSFLDIEKDKYRIIDCKGMKTEVFRIKEKLLNKILLEQDIQLEYEI